MAVKLTGEQEYDLRTQANKAADAAIARYKKTDEQRLKEAEAIYGPITDSSSSTQRRNVSIAVSRGRAQDNYIAEKERIIAYERAYSDLKKKALAAETTRVNEEARKAEDSARLQRIAADKKATETGQGVRTANDLQGLTAQQINNIRAAEQQVGQLPGAQQAASIVGSQQYQTYEEYLRSNPKEQELITQKAKEAVDPYFDSKQQFAQDQLNLKIQKFSDSLNALTEKEKLQLGRAIQNLDADATKALSAKFDDLAKRGALNSGFVKEFANSIVQNRDLEANYQEKLSDLSLRIAGIEKKYGTDMAQSQADEARKDLGYLRTKSLFEEEQDIAKQRSRLFGAYGQTEPGTPSTTIPGAAPESAASQLRQQSILPKAPSASSYYAPAGSSLALAQQQASGAISSAQQKAQRDALLMGQTTIPSTKGVITTPSISSIRTTPIAAPTSSVNLSSRTYTGAKPSSRR